MTGNKEDEPTIRAPHQSGSITTRGFSHSKGGSDAANAPLRPGSIIGRYEIIDCIDNGGMGVVYRARHTALGKPVALKVVSSWLKHEHRATDRFLREMQAVGRLDPHPNVLNAYDAGDADGVQYIATELIEGVQLASLVDRIGPLSISEACKIISQAALALEHLRKHELVHRDVKPSNLMLTREGVVKIVDLGLALVRDEQAEQITSFGETMGSIDYMAPEQWLDCHNVDWRSDIYSLGCTFYFLLAGHAPYSAHPRGSISKMRAHLESSFPDIRDDRGDVPEAAAAVLAAMVDKDPNQRLTDLVQLANQLDLIASGDLKGLVERGFAGSVAPRPLAAPASPMRVRPIPADAPTVADSNDQPGSARGPKTEPIKSGSATVARTAVAVVLTLTCVLGFLAIRRYGEGAAGEGDPREGDLATHIDPEPVIPLLSRMTAAEPIALIGHDSTVSDLQFLTPINRIASVSKDGLLCIFDLMNPGRALHTVTVSDRSADALAYDSAANTLIIVTEEGSLQIRSAEDGRELQEQKLRNVGFTSVTHIPETKAVITSDWSGDIRRVDLSTSPFTSTRIANRGEVVFDVDVSADGSLMAWVGRDPTVTLFNVRQAQMIDLSGHAQWVYDVAISPDGRRMATAGHEGVVRIWKLPSGDPEAEIKYVVPQAVCFFPDSRHLVMGGRGRKVQVWDLESERVVLEMPVANHTDSLGVSADGQMVAAGGNDGALTLWRISAAPQAR